MANTPMDLAALEKRLNGAKLRKDFLNNPVETLKSEGVTLTPEMERSVGYLVDRLKTPGKMIPGSGIAPGDLRSIRITITVDF